MQNFEKITEIAESSRPVDILNREGIVSQIMAFINVVSESKGSCTFSLNGRWGVGKSYVLNMLEEQLLTYQAGERYVVFHYNCWKYDYYEEPLFAIIASMMEGIDDESHLFSSQARKNIEKGTKLALEHFKNIASSISKAKIGVDVTELIDLLAKGKEVFDRIDEECAKKYEYDQYFSFNRTLRKTREELTELAQNHTIVVIVDELDRCLPTYAIKILERLHHAFYGIPNGIVVLGVEKNQLTHTIKQVFGEQIDVEHYLRKFIDFEMRLPSGDLQKNFLREHEKYISMFEDSLIDPNFNIEELCVALFGDQNIEIRRKEHLIEQITTAHRMLFNEQKKDYSFMCAELMWIALNEIYEERHTSPVVFKEGVLTIKSSRKAGLNIEDSEFNEYVNKCWSGINGTQTIEINELTGKEEKAVYFEEPLTMPQLLTWYLWRMYPMHAVKYGLRVSALHKSVFEQNAQDLKRLTSIMKIIK